MSLVAERDATVTSLAAASPPSGVLAWSWGWSRSALAMALVLALAGCATSPRDTAMAVPETALAPPPARAPVLWEQVGKASWYGRRHHGRPTASGEIYDMHALTAAHPTLPMGSRVLVTRPDTGHSVEVRINDRGPVVRGRIIDLSYAAARNLGAVWKGALTVRLSVLSAGSPSIAR